MEIVVVTGNGTSLVYTPRLAGPDLAEQITVELPAGLAEQLRSVARELGTDLAPGDRTTSSTCSGRWTASRPRCNRWRRRRRCHPTRQAPSPLRPIYCGRCTGRAWAPPSTSSLATRSRAMGPALMEYRKFVTWALGGLVPPDIAGVIRFFNLCYDGLLASQLFDQAPGAGFTVSDQALGYADLDIALRPGAPKVHAWVMRPASEPEYVPGPRAAVAYHLHGSLGWFRVPSTGQVFKATLAELRDEQGFYRRTPTGRRRCSRSSS